MLDKETEKRWTDIASRQLLGRTIVGVRYLSEKETRDLDWEERCIVIQLDDGNLIFPGCDDEANGAGALLTNDKQYPVIPVIF
jgi:hypothetical protein